MEALHKISLKKENHKGNEIVLIQFNYTLKLANQIKAKINIQWSKTFNSWYCLYSEFDSREFIKAFKAIADIEFITQKKQVRMSTNKNGVNPMRLSRKVITKAIQQQYN